MPRSRPDPTFYPSPKEAMGAPREEIGYVGLMDPTRRRPDALGIVDLDPDSPTYARLVDRVHMPSPGDEIHHVGWNACSSHLCASHVHSERRYLVVPGIHTSRITILDTRPNPRRPEIVKVIDGDVVARKTGYSAPHTTHAGPDGIYVNALGSADGKGPGGIFLLDHDSFEIRGAWEADRGDQYLAYDFWWHLGHDTLITSEWGTPDMVTGGLDASLLLAGKYGHALHVWDLKTRRHLRRLDLGREHQMVLELRPAHDPRRAYGFAGVVISLEDLSSSIWLWYLDGENGTAEWKTRKVITIPAQPARARELPPMLRDFGAVPPLVTDLNLSLDDRMLYVSCWGTGELLQYDVSDPFAPEQVGSVEIGGIVNRTGHPSRPGEPMNGGPQTVEISRDARRVYVTNSLHSAWDDQFYPDGLEGWMIKVDVDPRRGGLTLDRDFLVRIDDGMRPHQIRLQGGDASSDSYCFA
jgi:selenium-binding protein 1